ncbi:hypothetical protein B0T13DRAFT_499217 [Neurospora crassa]|nr:hypothetical protein B0T13DRAFT_499217 [Neurospora crassa]
MAKVGIVIGLVSHMTIPQSTGASGQDRLQSTASGPSFADCFCEWRSTRARPRRATVDPGPLGVDALRKYLPDPAGFRALRSSASSTGTGSYRVSKALLRNSARSGS